MVCVNNLLVLRGQVRVEHFNKDGKLLGVYEMPNGITDVGKDLALDVMFNDGSAVANSAWCLGLIDNSGFVALADADTMGSHAGWTEFTSYSESVRGAWGSGAAASETVTNAVAVTFSITGSGTLKGVFVTSINTKGGTTGTLWATALLAATVPVSNGDSAKVTYSVSA